MKTQARQIQKKENDLQKFKKIKHQSNLKKMLSALSVLFLTLLFMSHTELSGGAASPRTGSPGDGSTCTACHTGSQPVIMDSIISSNIPANGYTPDSTYTLTATINCSGHTCFGFELSPQDLSGNLLGKLLNISNDTKLVLSDKYITHTLSGTTGANYKAWTFNWRAPSAGTGAVTLYGAFLIADHNGGTSGDTTILSTLLVQEDLCTGINNTETKKMDLQVFANPITDRIQIDLNLLQAGNVNINLYNLNGKITQSLFSGYQLNTNNIYSFDRNPSLSPGIYFLKVEQGNKQLVKKVVLN